MTESLWKETAPVLDKPPLRQNIRTEVAVIGGGMAGILTAYLLTRAGKKAVVLEADRVGRGVTGNTTAKITMQHGPVYDRLIQKFGKEKAAFYADQNRSAVSEYREIIKQLSIDCDFEEQASYLYTCGADTELIEREAEAAKALGIHGDLTTKTGLPFPVTKALRFDRQYQFHPLLFLNRICDEITVYEKSEVTAVSSMGVRLTVRAGGAVYYVDADKVVFASHYPFVNFPGLYFIRMHQERSCVLAVKTKERPDHGMYFGTGSGELSFRRYREWILLGGGNYRTGKNRGNSYEPLYRMAEKWYPGGEISFQWSNQDCMPVDDVPFIGLYSGKTPDWYIASGFHKWGMSGAMTAALAICGHICGERKEFGIFSPDRFPLSASIHKLGENIAVTVKSFGLKLLSVPKKFTEELPAGEGRIVRYHGKKAGVFKDEEGRIYAVDISCPHLGCMLAWNPDEKTWDCPCHGSRFDYRGNRLDNPSCHDLKKVEK